MKILHIIPNLGVGGTEKILLELCRGLDRQKFEQRVIALKSGGPTAEELRKIRVKFDLLGAPDGFWPGLADLPRLLIALQAQIRERRADIVHTWLTRANVIGRLAARWAGAKHVVSSLRVMENEKAYHLWAEKLTQSLCEIVTVNCTPLKDFAIQKIGIPPDKIRLIFNGIKLEPLSLSQKEGPFTLHPSPFTLHPSPFTLGTMGRLHRQKGIDLFLKAAAVVLRKIPDCRFKVAGDGPEMKNLLALSETLGIKNRVDFAGTAPSISFLSGLDGFVLASRWEGLPNVVLEAMALGKPVAASSVGGVLDLIENDMDGLVFPPEDPEACAQAMIRLAGDASLRQRLGEAAQKKAAEKFSLSAMISAHASLYESIVPRP